MRDLPSACTLRLFRNVCWMSLFAVESNNGTIRTPGVTETAILVLEIEILFVSPKGKIASLHANGHKKNISPGNWFPEFKQ